MRRSLQILLVLLFAVRSFVPAGFMLQASPVDGQMQVVICTASGAKTISMDADGTPVPDAPGSASENCPFAAASIIAFPVETIPTLATEVRYAAIAYRLTADLYRATPKPHDLSARGPPAAGA